MNLIKTQIATLTSTQINSFTIGDYYTGENVADLLLALYGDYVCNNFYDNFKLWLKMNRENFIRILEALAKEYDITENYDKTSDTYTDNAEATTTTDITSPTMTQETKSASYDSENYKAQNKTETSMTGDNKTETSISFDKTGSDGHNTVFHEHTHGNIGVTTVAAMVEGEYVLRSKEYLIAFLNRFINTFAYYYWSDNE